MVRQGTHALRAPLTRASGLHLLVLAALAGAFAFVAGYDTVFDVDDAVRVLGDVAFVGYEDDRVAFRL